MTPRLWNSPAFGNSSPGRQTVREVLEIGVVADSILALSVTCGAVSVSREGAGVVLRTGASVRALYLDEGACLWWRSGASTSAASWSCRRTAGSLPGRLPEEVQGSLTDRGIEVRFPVDFRAEAAQRVKRVVRVRRKDQYRRA